jgi:exopolyphosphatase / guanosine-5'-triphosphate,3'-diphosphate pyrophosphatase
MTVVAAVDCGTNSLRLLVTDLDVGAGVAQELERRTSIVRLGEGVDRTGRFAPAALERTFAVLDDYARIAEELGATRVRMVATSAARDVDNRDEFVAGVRARIGVEPDVVTGDAEARLAYDGTMRGLFGVAGVQEPVLVLDVGGGSTELVASAEAVASAEPVTLPEGSDDVRSRSVDIGSVRITERFLTADPPLGAEVQAAAAHVEAALDTVEPQLLRAGTLVGVDGTIRTVAAVALDLPTYDKDRLHLARLPAGQVHEVRDRLLAMTVAERRAIPSMKPGRADVIAAGAMVLAAVLDRVAVDDVLVSKHDILDGIAWSMA